MVWFFIFLFGVAIGSFLNVVALRYDGEHFLFSEKQLGGRSHCPHCKKTLRWFELVPLVSFLIQGGRCRRCGISIGWRYPAVEMLSGIIFLAVPLHFSSLASPLGFFSASLIGLSAIWVLVFELLLLVAYIDIRLGIIPDELNILLFIVGCFTAWFSAMVFGVGNVSFFGSYAALFGLQGNIWINHLVGGFFGAAFFGAIVAVTRGKGMGMGDVKLAFPLGVLFGWPDVLIISMMAFVIGGVFGIGVIAFGKKTMKSAVAFGPFLVAASAITFFAGSALSGWYFHMLGL
jgi:prepilin signal peptidase PulO-like enzyme (type II secretory pathway)